MTSSVQSRPRQPHPRQPPPTIRSSYPLSVCLCEAVAPFSHLGTDTEGSNCAHRHVLIHDKMLVSSVRKMLVSSVCKMLVSTVLTTRCLFQQSACLRGFQQSACVFVKCSGCPEPRKLVLTKEWGGGRGKTGRARCGVRVPWSGGSDGGAQKLRRFCSCCRSNSLRYV